MRRPDDSPRRWALLASEQYSFPILRPLAAQAIARGHEVAWLMRDGLAPSMLPGELRLRSRSALKAFAPAAVFATVHRIPPWLPGLQVQLFHGLNLSKRDPKRGHFRISDLFDLYCTHGPVTTQPMQALADEHRDFLVVETGWPKLDTLFAGAGERALALRRAAAGRAVVMYASTFNEPLSRARDCLPVIEELVRRGDRYWLLTLHPVSPPDLVEQYRRLAGANAVFLCAERLADMLHAADILVCDTSSVIEEFALLGKPVVSVCHRQPQAFMLDVGSPDAIDAAIASALADLPERYSLTKAYADAIHPTRDTGSSARVLDAVESVLRGERATPRRRRRPVWRRWWRSWRMLCELLPG
ncbi:CDP-glycerol glycerophosphotransferase family protein [Lysobacter sp. LF1]|uniref:CDP-glycerol glycerophosphotransferase family protein n=1 Tax=Lysobacter stagni TaxID=3045172 RepID=A0ABT6XES9_9GAMM|nr:CDP-glycerol glycerophosphotransferase family protein [Lysobacter sp. LF1]MDI9238650.1 CDP-glycerol glycerophosphotransferase family protein [Lysobacter sp. LF1]